MKLLMKWVQFINNYQNSTLGRPKIVCFIVCYCCVTYKFQGESALNSLSEFQGTPCLKQAPYIKFKRQQQDSNPQPLSLQTNTQPFSQTGQGLNLFDECAARCVHLFTQEEECTSFSCRDSKMYTCDSISNSQRMLTEINKSGAIVKIRGFEWKVILSNNSAFWKISSEMKISLFILML